MVAGTMFFLGVLLMPLRGDAIKFGRELSKLNGFFSKHATKCGVGLCIVAGGLGIEAAWTGNQLHGFLAMGGLFNGAAILVLAKTRMPGHDWAKEKAGRGDLYRTPSPQGTDMHRPPSKGALERMNIKWQGVLFGIKNAFKPKNDPFGH